MLTSLGCGSVKPLPAFPAAPKSDDKNLSLPSFCFLFPAFDYFPPSHSLLFIFIIININHQSSCLGLSPHCNLAYHLHSAECDLASGPQLSPITSRNVYSFAI